jgi:pimeloyl-ACP methyl ester carboxylesterase
MIKWLKRIAIGATALIVLVVAGGAIYEQFARERAARLYPAPGKLVDIGGRRIQLDCRGAGTPTVVFESGLDGLGSLSWVSVHGDIAKITRACAYSRAGLMWSDMADRPFNSSGAAGDLHKALDVTGEKPPYVIVGHSLGGPYALAFTSRYGPDVAGLVFVDASHPDQIARLRAALGKDLDSESQLKAGAALAWTGLIRLFVATNSVVPLHAPWQIAAPAGAYLPPSLHAMLQENEALHATLDAAGRVRRLGDRPLIVLTHGERFPPDMLRAQGISAAAAARLDSTWLELQNDEATWSSRSRHQVVAGASHYIQFDRPDVVVAAVREVVNEVRAGGNAVRAKQGN